ncbi:JAB domain-containing protein [Pseudomonas sp. X10]
MRLHKLKANDSPRTYLIESPITETDILLMALQLANLRMRRGRSQTSPKTVSSHLQAPLGDYEHEVFALLHLDSRPQGSSEAQRRCIDPSAQPSLRGPESQADRNLLHKRKEALYLVGVRTLGHIIVGREGCLSLAEQGHL